MKILVVHNEYQQRGGEDSVVSNEIALLRRHGHDVLAHVVSNDGITSWWRKGLVAVSSIFSPRSYHSLFRLISAWRPDVVHVHNFFPLVSPSVFYACSRAGVASVFTLHNYRILCPTALLMFEGRVTERSLSGNPFWTVPHRVYRNSLAGTFVLALMIFVHRCIGTWSKRVTRFIVLTEFASDKFAEGGLPPGKIRVKPNFVDVPRRNSRSRNGFLYVGRLSQEKGVKVLLQAWGQVGDETSLRVAGAGPLASQLQGIPGVVALGALPTSAIYHEMTRARALVMPSLWYEGFPMVLVEAYAAGLPVIASNLGAMAELVEEGVTGLLFEAGSAKDFAAKIMWAIEHPAEMAIMGSQAREKYEAVYTAERNYARLIDIYNEAVVSEQQGRS